MNSHLHVAFAGKESTVRKVFYVRSTDRGDTWLPAVAVEERPAENRFFLVADSAGNVHLVNRRYSDNGLYYRRSTDGGDSWQPAVLIAPACENALLLTRGQQTVYIINDVPGSPPMLELYKSSDGGATWLPARLITTRPLFYSLCGCADAQGRIGLFYSIGDSAGQLCLTRSLDDGASWTDTVVPTPGPAMPTGAWSHDDYVFVASLTFGDSVNFRRSIDAGTNWLPGQSLSALMDAVAWTSNGEAHALGVMGDTEVVWLMTTDGGAAWSVPVAISGESPGTRATPLICAGDVCRLHAVWSEVAGLYYAFADTMSGIGEYSTPGSLGPVSRSTIVCGVLYLRLPPLPLPLGEGEVGREQSVLLDATGRKAAELHPGPNDVRRLVPGIYFMRLASSIVRSASRVTKVVVQR